MAFSYGVNNFRALQLYKPLCHQVQNFFPSTYLYAFRNCWCGDTFHHRSNKWMWNSDRIFHGSCAWIIQSARFILNTVFVVHLLIYSTIRINLGGQVIFFVPFFINNSINFLQSCWWEEAGGRQFEMNVMERFSFGCCRDSQINPTMNGRGRSVLIWGQTCRTLLVDKGKPLSGDKGTRTEEHGPKTQQGRIACVRMNVYTYGLNCICVRTELKCVFYAQ